MRGLPCAGFLRAGNRVSLRPRLSNELTLLGDQRKPRIKSNSQSYPYRLKYEYIESPPFKPSLVTQIYSGSLVDVEPERLIKKEMRPTHPRSSRGEPVGCLVLSGRFYPIG